MPDIDKLMTIFARSFPDAQIPENFIDLQLGDFKEWDSLGNFNLLLAIEESYGIRLDMEDMATLKSVKDFLQKLDKEGF